MGHKNKKSLTRQVQETFESKLRIGHSKHKDKYGGVSDKYIYSYGTLKSYMKEANYFVKYCKENHKCKTLEQCRPYISEWIDSRRHLSAYTLKLDLSALAKLYGVKATDFGIETPARVMSNITRSRGVKKRDKHFSEKRNVDLVYFCRCTGLRRSELAALRGDMLAVDDMGRLCINVTVGSKGGRPRLAPIIGDVERITKLMHAAGSGKVFPKVPSGADIHSYRADYATAIYNQYARPLNKIPYDKINKGTGRRYQSEVYICRGENKGKRLDKRAMLEASHALGHNRICVVGEHYIH